MTIKSLIIPFVENIYTAEYIANAFWYQGVARVSRITLLPDLYLNIVYYMAYVEVEEWFDTEFAYNFIYNLKYSNKIAILNHNDELFWQVGINTHNSGNLFLYSYTSDFHKSFFIKDDVYNKENEIIDNIQYIHEYLKLIQDSDSEYNDSDSDSDSDSNSNSNSDSNSDPHFAKIHAFSGENCSSLSPLNTSISSSDFNNTTDSIDSNNSFNKQYNKYSYIQSSIEKPSYLEQENEWHDLNHEIKQWKIINNMILEMMEQNPNGDF
jgi:hypothetical protein